jgi:hypothetical protein
MQCIWNVKENLILVITGAYGTISKSLGYYLSNIPGRHEIEELQDTVVLDTTHNCGKC